MMKRLGPLFPALLLALLLLAGCTAGPAQTPSRRGGTVILALYQEPDTLNPYLASQRAAGEVHTFILEGLLGVNEQGEFYPVLATQVPSRENGGISADGLTLTYHLRPDVTWSDGQPFTCDDVRFTWEANVNPKSGAVSTAGYRDIDSITCADPHTAVIHFRNLYAAELVLFWSILPRHATGDPADMPHWEFNRHPIGTGPFKMTEWVSADHITLVRNGQYWEKDKPFLDSVVIRFVPSRDVALQLLRSGEVTIVWDLVEANLPALAKVQDVKIGQAPGPRSERLALNLADPTIDTPDDPAAHPHPILGDARVRGALEAAIDKRELVDQLLNGQAVVGTNELNVGWARCETSASKYDPARARQLLDEAGWQVGPDGIRVARTAQYAPPGTRLRLKLQGPTGDSLRDQVEQLLVEKWKSIGVEAYIENVPTAVLFGTWESGGVARHGKFDLLLYSTGPYVDPHSQIEGYFASWSIPRADNHGSGYNYSRWINASADQAIRLAGSTPDAATRRSAYCNVMDQVNRERPQIYLFSRLFLAGYRDQLQGWSTNVWKNLGWNAADWWLK